MKWEITDGADEMLKKLRSKGYSYSVIARQISVAFKVTLSRGACVGRAHRIGMFEANPLRKRGGQNRGRKSPESKTRTANRQRSPLASFLASKAIAMPDIEPPADDVAKVPLLDLEPHHCRYPIGTPGKDGFGFCGDRHIPGRSYCERHAIRCMVPETVRTHRRREFVLRKIGIEAARELRTALEDA